MKCPGGATSAGAIHGKMTLAPCPRQSPPIARLLYSLIGVRADTTEGVRRGTMAILESRIDTRAPEFIENRARFADLVTDLRERLALVARGGDDESRARHIGRGKLLVRDRIARLLDPDTPFLEFSPLAAWGMYDDEAPGAGIVTGIGVVAGQEVVVVANDATIKGGTY